MASPASNWVKLTLALGLIGCSQPPAPDRWHSVASFACQLQNLDPAKAPEVDLLITDPTRDGSTPLNPSEMSLLRSDKRLLLGYLSIGEAENYRPYWQKTWKPGKPSWLGPTNPEWGGNYKVRYWDPGWRQLVLQNARSLQEQGFDGLFLDVVDGWEFWQHRYPKAKAEMVTLVLELTAQMRERRADFGIFLNGGEGLLQDPNLLRAVTGLVKEEIFFGLDGDGRPTPSELTRAWQAHLQPAVQAGKLVLSIDYTDDPGQKRQARQMAKKAGYLEFIGARHLDKYPIQP